MTPLHCRLAVAAIFCHQVTGYQCTASRSDVIHCTAGATTSAAGWVQAGPLDAGKNDTWFIVSVDAEMPAGTSVELALYVSDDATVPPAAGDWITIPGQAARVDAFFKGSGQYLWLKAALATTGAQAAPRIEQIRAETAGDDYLDHLPEIYRISDASSGFLSQLLSLLREQFDTSERLIDGLPQRVSIDFALDRDLPWLASWLAFDLPGGLPTDLQRALLKRVIQLYDRRGTREGLAEFVQIYTGVQPTILESFQERHIWQLGFNSLLGFDTALAPQDPVGMVVPDDGLLDSSVPSYGCDPSTRLTIGSVVVGQDAPIKVDDLGSPLFIDTAHRFRVVVSARQAPDQTTRDAIRRVLDSEKPAHTDYVLCVIEPMMRVGMQSVIGVDTIVAQEPAAATLARITLDVDSYLSEPDSAGRIGARSRLGVTTLLA